MLRLRAVLLAAMLIVPLQSAMAVKPGSQQWMVNGEGLESCGAWIKDRKANANWVAAGEWILGFQSGVGWGREGADPLEGLDVYAVWAWYDNYCATHPLDGLVAASLAFFRTHPHN
jgi:hypothetical protein